MSETLIFVYHADSGVLNGLTDLIHKNLSPETHACRLCAMTYDKLGVRREWRIFIGHIDRKVEFQGCGSTRRR